MRIQITGGRWNLESFCNKVSVKLLKILLVVNWRGKLVDGNLLAGAIHQVFEKYERNRIYKDSGAG